MKSKGLMLIATALIAALMLPGVALGETSDAADIDAILAGMTLEEKVGQMMVAAFRIWKEVPPEGAESAEEPEAINITELNDEIRACLRDYHFGGVVLYAENCRDAEQVLRLVSQLQTENRAGGGLPLLVAADQEGGTVARLGFGTSGVGNMALAATGDPGNARRMAAIHGEELRLVGVNTDFAPVMDVNNHPNNPVIGVRAFGDEPQRVSEYGLAFLEGLRSTGTIATLKHFPGHGDTGVDSHTGLPLIERSYDELKAVELVPFQAAIDAGADAVMTAHIQYPQIEKETYVSVSTGEEITLPATMSRVILTDILRGEMGFEGVVFSDALDMAAIKDHFTDEDKVKLTINAGVDMLLLPLITDTDLFQQNKDMVDTAVRLVREGEISEARVDEAVRRILTLKRKYGILELSDFTVTDAQVEAAVSGVGSAEHRQVAWDIAEKANTLLKNENGAFPIRMSEGETALILFSDSCASRVGAGDLVKGLLGDAGEAIIVMKSDTENASACLEAAAGADHVILVDRVYNAACLDPNTDDGFSTGVFDRIIEACHAANKPVIVVSSQLPYDAARFTEADALLLTYGSSVMRAVPAQTGPGSAYAPNLPAALCACFGVGEASGKLPVDLPELNGDYAITGKLLYGIGESAEQP